jgi:hypothetical protein
VTTPPTVITTNGYLDTTIVTIVDSDHGRLTLAGDLLGIGLRIDHADPRILLPRDAINGVRRRTSHPAVLVDGPRLIINGTNRRVVYEVGRYLKAIDSYELARVSDEAEPR